MGGRQRAGGGPAAGRLPHLLQGLELPLAGPRLVKAGRRSWQAGPCFSCQGAEEAVKLEGRGAVVHSCLS